MARLFFVDVDGTILDGSRKMFEVSEKTRYAFDELKKNDYVIIASGRCMGLMDNKIISLNPSGYILCNGAYASVGNKEVYALYFEKQDLDKIVEVSMKYEGFYILETYDEMYIDSLDSKPFRTFMSGWASALDGFKEGDIEAHRYMIAMIGFLDPKVKPYVEEELKGYVDLAAHKMFSSYDVNIRGVNKGTGVEKLREYLHVKYEDTYAFGDALNDVEMLQAVNHPVVVANCAKELKAYDFEKTDDVLDDGFYNYLVSNKLIKPL
jgi:Cof subfamily protein (haloacid dehalogenase superfamily)